MSTIKPPPRGALPNGKCGEKLIRTRERSPHRGYTVAVKIREKVVRRLPEAEALYFNEFSFGLALVSSLVGM